MTAQEAFTAAYIAAMEFTDCHSDNPELNDADGFSAELLKEVKEDCSTFYNENLELLDKALETGYTIERAGHDFWLTRNGHGAGFWDRGLGEIGEWLTSAAAEFGSFDLYAGDDGLIYGT